MNFEFDISEFNNFRLSHSRVNRILSTIYVLIAFLFGCINWIVGVEIKFFSEEFILVLVICGVVSYFIPLAGYRLARNFVGKWYRPEFGATYSEYRKNEKLIAAAILLDNEEYAVKNKIDE